MSSSLQLVSFSRPSPKNGYYDIFISFRGKDTRYGFTNNLYCSLRANELYTFMDVSLVGEKIDNLFEIIEKSRMAVVVYSENFAESDWCLKELETILKRKQEKKMLLTPIFYKVDVHDLKHLSGQTGEHLDKHISKYDETTVKNWKDVVTNFGGFSGVSYKDIHGRFESDFIADVIAKIKIKLEECEEPQESCIMEHPKVEIQERSEVEIQEHPKVEIQEHPKVEIQERPKFEIKLEHTHLIQQGEVTCVDLHPTEPWVLLTSTGTSLVRIWNYKSRTVVRLYEVKYKKVFFSFLQKDAASNMSIFSAKFIPEKEWFVVGDSYGFVHVVHHNTLDEIIVFKAHVDDINCVVVHPTSPYILTVSEDKLIKLWNWEANWTCIQTFEGHSGCVTQVAFNPKDYSSFASASLDGTIKVWNFGSLGAKFTIDTFDKRVNLVDKFVKFDEMGIIISRHNPLNCVEYFVGNDDNLYLLSGSDDLFIKIWDYKSRNLVQTVVGFSNNVVSTLVHPELPIIITGSEDKTMRLWNKNTYQLELEWTGDFRSVWSMKFIKASNEVVIGCNKGMLVIKILNVGTQSD